MKYIMAKENRFGA